MEKKIYHYETFDYIYDAMEEMNKHQDWNIINVYPTGWRNAVCVVYYKVEMSGTDFT